MIYGKEEQKKAIKARAELLRKIAGYYPTLAKIYKEFDGKVYNCRLEKAIKEATDNKVFCNVRLNYIEVYYYVSGSTYTLTQVNKSDMKDAKRISAELFTESTRNQREQLLKDAAALDTAAENLETITAQLNDLKKTYNVIVDSLPYFVLDTCNIKKMY